MISLILYSIGILAKYGNLEFLSGDNLMFVGHSCEIQSLF